MHINIYNIQYTQQCSFSDNFYKTHHFSHSFGCLVYPLTVKKNSSAKWNITDHLAGIGWYYQRKPIPKKKQNPIQTSIRQKQTKQNQKQKKTNYLFSLFFRVVFVFFVFSCFFFFAFFSFFFFEKNENK